MVLQVVQPTISESDEELMNNLRCVIITRSKDGACIDEIIDDYYELTGEHLLGSFYSRNDLMTYLSMIDGVWYSTDGTHGIVLWYCSTPRTKHLVEMIERQKSTRAANYRRYMPRQMASNDNSRSSNDNNNNNPTIDSGTTTEQPAAAPIPPPYFANNWRLQRPAKDNYTYGSQRPKRPIRYCRPSRMVRPRPYEGRHQATSNNNDYRPNWRRPRTEELDFRMYGPSYHQHQLVGDDFFLAIAKWELKYSFDPGHDIEMSGLCISGLTLSEAAKRIQVVPYIAQQVLLNVGTVDLLHGRVMVDLIHDFEQLLARFRDRGVEPIVTTLAPIANCGGKTPMAERLLKFNEYIRRTCPRHIDLWKHFVHADGSMRFECYQPAPRTVTGSIRPHVLWNKLGRHHLLSVLGHEIGDQLIGGDRWPAPERY